MHRDIIQHIRFSFQVLDRGKARENFEIVNEMRLVVESVSQGDFAPVNGLGIFNFKDRFLKAHDFHILPWSDSHLLLEQTDEVLL